ncbi:MAG: TolC family protein [Candidatus Latescibacteria bacterium]|nr:TolC family protein [Candidatus Latescibacterota bacterium]
MIYIRKLLARNWGRFACLSASIVFLSSDVPAQQSLDNEQSASVGDRLTLEQCIQIALQRNTQILISQGNVIVSEAQAYGSMTNVLPRINVSLMNTSKSYLAPRDVFLQDGTFFGTRPSSSTTNVSTGINLNQTIYNGGQSWNIIKQARQNVKNSNMGVDNTRNLVIGNVRNQYINLLRTIRLKEVTEEQLKLNEEQLRRSQSMYEIGSVAKVDVLQARATIGNTRIAIYNQETQVRQAKASLNTALGRNINQSVEIVDVLDPDQVSLPPAPMSVEDAVAVAMSENPALKQQNGFTTSQRMAVRINKGALWPTVTGSIGYNRNAQQFGDVYGEFGRNWRWSFGLNVSLSFLNGTQTLANIQAAQASLVNAEVSLENVRLNTGLAVKQALLSMEAAREVTQLSSENILAAEESMRLAQERYRVGSGTQLDVFTAQLSVFQAKANLVSAQYDYKIAEASLNQQMGR